jgi:hypothetical protein
MIPPILADCSKPLSECRRHNIGLRGGWRQHPARAMWETRSSTNASSVGGFVRPQRRVGRAADHAVHCVHMEPSNHQRHRRTLRRRHSYRTRSLFQKLFSGSQCRCFPVPLERGPKYLVNEQSVDDRVQDFVQMRDLLAASFGGASGARQGSQSSRRCRGQRFYRRGLQRAGSVALEILGRMRWLQFPRGQRRPPPAHRLEPCFGHLLPAMEWLAGREDSNGMICAST